MTLQSPLEPTMSQYDNSSSTIGNEIVVSHHESGSESLRENDMSRTCEIEASLSKQSTDDFDETGSVDTLRGKGFVDRLGLHDQGAASILQQGTSSSASLPIKTGAHLNRNRAKARWLTAYKKITDSFDEQEVSFDSNFTSKVQTM